VTTSFGEEDSISANAQLGEAAAPELLPGMSVFAWAWVVMKTSSPTATTSIASKPKRFIEKNRIEPPRILLVLDG
jgi:hypothetical protein